VSDGPTEQGRSPSGRRPLFAILTLFPEALRAYVAAGIVGQACRRGVVDIRLVDFRDFARDRHRSVDDRPFGGGPGMVLRPEPIAECVEWLERREGAFRKLLLCPGGRRFDQERALELSSEARLLLLCGRYEGVDERVVEACGFEPLSLGDFVLAGGEIAALAVTEACVRLLPGALGDERSAEQDSFRPADGAVGHKLLDHPHYTRPRLFRGRPVPEVLLGGDHARIAEWRERMAIERTRKWRPDLLSGPSPRSAADDTSGTTRPHEVQPPLPSPPHREGSAPERTRPVPRKGRSEQRGSEQ
jgi:tRNA (guanine37-N1)-methyltransferase